jgi:hypothetical protein
MWFPQSRHRDPMSRGESDGQVKAPSVTGVWFGMVHSPRVARTTLRADL